MNKVFKISRGFSPLLWRGAGVRSFYIAIIAISLLTVSSCKKDKKSEDYRVTWGNTTVGCYLNGSPYVANYYDYGNYIGPVGVGLMYTSGYHYLTIGAHKNNSHISIYVGRPLKLGLHKIDSGINAAHTHIGNTAEYSNYNPYKNYYTNDSVNGTLNFTICDTIQNKFEGTFEFEAINKQTHEKVKITNGYFRKG